MISKTASNIGGKAVAYVESLNLRSASKLRMQMVTCKSNPATKSNLKKLTKTIQKKLDTVRNFHFGQAFSDYFKSFDEFATSLKKLVLKQGAADCGEQSIIVAKFLKDKGENSQALVSMVIKPKNRFLAFLTRHFDKKNGFRKGGNNHAFNLNRLNPEAKISDPNTWMNNSGTTKMIDAWAEFCEHPDKGLEILKKLFNVKKWEKIEFYDSAKILSSQKGCPAFKEMIWKGK